MEVDLPRLSNVDLWAQLSIDRNTREVLQTFCATNDPQDEYNTLERNAAVIVNEICADAVSVVACRCNQANHTLLAYQHHRKASILGECIKYGVPGFFEQLANPVYAAHFFDLIGPPPLSDEKLYESYLAFYRQYGDTVHSPPVHNDPSESEFLARLLEEEAQWIMIKHNHGRYRGYTTQWMGISSITKSHYTHMDNKFIKRKTIMVDFLETQGMKELLNWLSCLSFDRKRELFTDILEETTTQECFLDFELNPRQKEMCVPELSNVLCLLDPNNGFLLDLYIRVAFGKENNTIDKEDDPILAALEQNLQTTDPTIEKRVGHILKLQQHYATYFPAVLRTELFLEQEIVAAMPEGDRNIIEVASKEYLGRGLEQYGKSHRYYRTWQLQLFFISLIGQCLHERLK